MPFKSEKQRRLFWAKANRGEMPKSTVERWEKETPNKKLPLYVGKKHGAFLVSAFLGLEGK